MLAPIEQPKRIFLGRDRELQTLLAAWETAQRHPAVVLLRGPTGRGKTSLIQELYARMSESQQEPYWPDEVGEGLLPQGAATDGTPPPWLWFAVRCVDPDAGASLRPLEMLRAQMLDHLAGVYAGVARRGRRNKAARAALTLVATFGLPGSATAVEIGTRLAKNLDDMLDPVEATRDLIEHVRDATFPSAARDPDAAAKAFETELIDSLRALIENLETADGRRLPIVIVVDDAHWGDMTTLGVLDQVARHAQDEQWPLLMLIAAWDEALATEGSDRERSPLATFVRAMEEREALRKQLWFSTVAVRPLEPAEQRSLIEQRIPTFPPERHEILLERSSGDLELLEDFCTEIRGASHWRDPEDRIVVPEEELRRLPATKADMARRRLRSAGPELGELLAMGSAQGWKFFEQATVAMAEARGRDRRAVGDLFGKADRPHRICAVALHEILGHAAEFRAYPYYEESRKSFDQMPDRDTLLRALATVLRDRYLDDRFASLRSLDRLEVLEDLVQVGCELKLRHHPQWRTCLDDCALDLAAAQLHHGHPATAVDTALAVLANVADDSERGQRALATLCEAAHVTGESADEDAFLDRWWAVPGERRSADAFVRSARRDIRDGRGNAAVATIDQLLARGGHDRVEGLLIELERARALCYSDAAADAGASVEAVEAKTAAHPVGDPQFAVRLHHTAYIAAHNAERNDDAVSRADACMRLYERAGLREGYLLSRINLADARWGTGEGWAAPNLLRAVRAQAVEEVFAHPRALSALCLANVIADSRPDEARELYEVGIVESVRAEWRYDELYGRIYVALLDAETRDLDGSALHDLSGTASSFCLAYLADVASGLGAMRDAVVGRAPRAARDLLERAGAAPFARVYAAAALVTVGDDAAARTALFATLAGIQGLKGRPRFVERAALAVATNDAEHGLAQRFAERFRP